MSALASLAAALFALVSDPTPMTVPGALLASTSMPEPSGIVWSPALSRYLIISDDTGDKQQGTNHAPWLFSMSRDGAIDPTPIPILGIEKLNDAEALCAGPGGTYFLSTSHSKNKKGQDKKERRRLFHLELQGRALKILSSLDMASAITDSGVVPQGPVDIEAMAFRSGDLYVGLKAPQTTEGSAIILRIRNLMPSLAAGRIAPTDVERFSEVPLHVDGPSGKVIQGISDMSFLPDGSLVLLANSPKKMPPDGGGALYFLRPGEAPRLLRRFLGLKPEGVTLTDDQKSLIIVFDNDRRQPLWLREPLPADKASPAAPHKAHSSKQNKSVR